MAVESAVSTEEKEIVERIQEVLSVAVPELAERLGAVH